MKFLSFEILYIFFNFQILKLLNFNFFLENIDPLPMVYQPPYPWNIDPPYLWYFDPLPMVFWPPFPWYIDPPTHGILTPLPMVYRPPYTWYFDLPAYLLIRNGGVQNTMGVQFTIQGGSVFNKGVQYTMDVNRPRVQFTMGFKIPYDTGPDRYKSSWSDDVFGISVR